jgi:hypothetical protein
MDVLIAGDVETVQRLTLSFLLGVDKQLSLTSVSVPTTDGQWLSPTQQVARVVADTISEVGAVRSVCMQSSPECHTVWTLMQSYDPDARDAVYTRELRICERLNAYDFDFRVTSLDLVSRAELLATGFIEIFKRS